MISTFGNGESALFLLIEVLDVYREEQINKVFHVIAVSKFSNSLSNKVVISIKAFEIFKADFAISKEKAIANYGHLLCVASELRSAWQHG